MIVANIYIYGEITDDTVKSVEAQLSSQRDADEIRAYYDSKGGGVVAGRNIKRLLLEQNKPLTSIAIGDVMSIATEPFLAASKRLYKKGLGDRNIMIHNPWGQPKGDADKMRWAAEQLAKMEDEMASNYEEATTLSKEEALALMKKQSFLSIQEALKIGFLHEEYEDTLKAVAKLDFESNSNNTDMTKEEAKALNENISGFKTMLNKFMAAFKPKALVVQDAEGVEIDFPDISEGESPSIGDSATVDGNPASGEYVMPEGSTYVFTDGQLSEIKEASNEDEDMEALKEENEAVKAENSDLKKEVKALKEEKESRDKEIEEFKALQKETSDKFNALQESLKGADIDLEGFQGKGSGNDGGQEPKSRRLFKQD